MTTTPPTFDTVRAALDCIPLDPERWQPDIPDFFADLGRWQPDMPDFFTDLAQWRPDMPPDDFVDLVPSQRAIVGKVRGPMPRRDLFDCDE